MDISSIISDVSVYSECFSTNQNENKNNTKLSDEAIEIACSYFEEAFSSKVTDIK